MTIAPFEASMRLAAIATLWLFAAGLAMAQVSSQEAMRGQWVASDSTGATTVFRLEADGSCSIDADGGRCEFAGNRITFRNAAGALSYVYNLRGNQLTFTGGDLDRPLVFQRAVAAAPSPAPAAAPAWRNPDTVPRQAVPQPMAPTLGGQHPLIGRWAGPKGELVVARDGTLSLNGEPPSRWQIQGGSLILSNDQGTTLVPFQVQGNMLTAVADGEQLVFQRLAGAAPETAIASRRPAGGLGGGSGQELVGTWCYMANVNAQGGGRMSNRCFTLNPNGSYTYRSETSTSTSYGGTSSASTDAGTWRTGGGVIYVNSRGQGPLQYRLEKRNHPRTGDPMICLEGDCYVTTTQRRPW